MSPEAIPSDEQCTVSVIILTCNHEQFIAQAIESVLAQKTTFRTEIIIGADVSADKTREIVLRYQELRPDIIRAVLPEENIGVYRNFHASIAASRGKYIALLDGDDYWTDPDKLQKQVALLESSPEHALCFHKVVLLRSQQSADLEYMPQRVKTVSTLRDLLERNFIQLTSVVIRRTALRNVPECFFRFASNDWPVWLLAAESGTLAYMDEAMAVYRQHGASAWSSKPPTFRTRQELEFFQVLKDYYRGRFHEELEQQIFTAHVNCAVACAAEGNGRSARRHALECLRSRPYNRNIVRKCAISARAYLPGPLFAVAKAFQVRLRRLANFDPAHQEA